MTDTTNTPDTNPAQGVNYRDGEWHEWEGGECPVRDEDEVEVVFRHLWSSRYNARIFCWSHIGERYDIIKFRVIRDPLTAADALAAALEGVDLPPQTRALLAAYTQARKDAE